MKLIVYHATDGWRWALIASNNKNIASGEAYTRAQAMVKSLEKYIVRGDAKLKASLTASLAHFKLDPEGKQMKFPKDTSQGIKWTDKQ